MRALSDCSERVSVSLNGRICNICYLETTTAVGDAWAGGKAESGSDWGKNESAIMMFITTTSTLE